MATALPGSTEVAFGRVTGAYRFDADAAENRQHQRPVEWRRRRPRAALDGELLAAVDGTRGARKVRDLPPSDAPTPDVPASDRRLSRRAFVRLGAAAGARPVLAAVWRPWRSSSEPTAVPTADQLKGKPAATASSLFGRTARWVQVENAVAWDDGVERVERRVPRSGRGLGQPGERGARRDARPVRVVSGADVHCRGVPDGLLPRQRRPAGLAVGEPARDEPAPAVEGAGDEHGHRGVDAVVPAADHDPVPARGVPGEAAKLDWVPAPHPVHDPRRQRATAKYLVQNSVTSWQAYNQWGGYSLYYGLNGRGQDYANRARVVSFDRPYDKGDGSSDFLGLELPLIMLMESMGLDVTYTTDVDVHPEPERLAAAQVVLVARPRRVLVDGDARRGRGGPRPRGSTLRSSARTRRSARSGSSRRAGPNRLQVCYKDAAEDPMSRVNPALTTVNWREPPLNRPESLMIGQQYESNPVNADMVFVDPSAWMFQRTGVQAGSRIPIGVGSEYDRYYPSQQGPQNVQILAHSPLVCQGRSSFGDMTYYSAAERRLACWTPAASTGSRS